MGYVQYFDLDMNTKIQREIVKVRSGGSITIPSETYIFFLNEQESYINQSGATGT